MKLKDQNKRQFRKKERKKETMFCIKGGGGEARGIFVEMCSASFSSN